MKSEAEIRKYRDRMLQVLRDAEAESDDEGPPEDYERSAFLMKSHVMLLSWVLGECDDVDIPMEVLDQ